MRKMFGILLKYKSMVNLLETIDHVCDQEGKEGRKNRYWLGWKTVE